MATHSTFVGYLFWLLFGWAGVHRLYLGKRVSGAVWAVAAAAIAGLLAFRHFRLHTPLGVPEQAALGALALIWLIDALLIPRMRRQMARHYQVGRYDYSKAWLLLVLLGVLGAHRFYLQRWATAVLYLLTLGLLGLGVLYDMVTFNETLSEANETWISGAPQTRDSLVG